MRYTTNDAGYLLEVAFGAAGVSCEGRDCARYDGDVPSGYDSLGAWFAGEYHRLYQWKVVDGNLTRDSSAVEPSDTSDYVIEQGVTDGWTWRKWASGVSECWGFYDVVGADCSTAAGALYRTDTISPDMLFPAGLFIDADMTMQMTFHSYQGTPAFVWINSGVNKDDGANDFMLMRHAAETITGRMQYSYTGRWKE